MTQLRIRSTYNLNTVDFMAWCRDLQFNDAYRPNVNVRFGIAFYQIYQAIKWESKDGNLNPNAQESYMASAVHLTCVMEYFDIDLYSYLMVPNLRSISSRGTLDYKEILYNMAHTQQMLHYYSNMKKTSRNSRFNKNSLKNSGCVCIKQLISMVPRNSRANALQNATEIMTGAL